MTSPEVLIFARLAVDKLVDCADVRARGVPLSVTSLFTIRIALSCCRAAYHAVPVNNWHHHYVDDFGAKSLRPPTLCPLAVHDNGWPLP